MGLFLVDRRSRTRGNKKTPRTCDLETIYLEAEIDKHATPATYDVPLLIRAKGDSNQNDNTIYTYRSSTDINIEENTKNFYALIAIVLVLGFAAIFVWGHYK